MVYGFHRPPRLDVEISWTETHDIFIPPNFHKVNIYSNLKSLLSSLIITLMIFSCVYYFWFQEWMFSLNEGSQVNISYAIRSASSLPLSLVIAQGYLLLR